MHIEYFAMQKWFWKKPRKIDHHRNNRNLVLRFFWIHLPLSIKVSKNTSIIVIVDQHVTLMEHFYKSRLQWLLQLNKIWSRSTCDVKKSRQCYLISLPWKIGNIVFQKRSCLYLQQFLLIFWFNFEMFIHFLTNIVVMISQIWMFGAQ